jgi:hypothetical protein
LRIGGDRKITLAKIAKTAKEEGQKNSTFRISLPTLAILAVLARVIPLLLSPSADTGVLERL